MNKKQQGDLNWLKRRLEWAVANKTSVTLDRSAVADYLDAVNAALDRPSDPAFEFAPLPTEQIMEIAMANDRLASFVGCGAVQRCSFLDVVDQLFAAAKRPALDRSSEDAIYVALSCGSPEFHTAADNYKDCASALAGYIETDQFDEEGYTIGKYVLVDEESKAPDHPSNFGDDK